MSELKNQNKMRLPLMSIVVVTYNSAKYIIETLESIKEQTYQNIELIITDDCSKDDTVSLCTRWIADHASRFENAQLITTDSNSGIAANCNRGFKAAKGEWIKGIAGDDAFFPNAIEDFIKCSYDKIDNLAIQTKVEVFDNTFNEENSRGVANLNNETFFERNSSSLLQLKFFLSGGFLISPGVFYSRYLFQKVGYFDERYKRIEDIPFYLKVTAMDIRVITWPVLTVKYRKHDESMTFTKKSFLPSYSTELYTSMLRTSLRKKLPLFICNSIWNLVMVKIIISLGNKGQLCRFLNLARKKFSPIRFFESV